MRWLAQFRKVVLGQAGKPSAVPFAMSLRDAFPRWKSLFILFICPTDPFGCFARKEF